MNRHFLLVGFGVAVIAGVAVAFATGDAGNAGSEDSFDAVERQYAERGSFEQTLDIQRQIVAGYRADVRKYVEGLD